MAAGALCLAAEQPEAVKPVSVRDPLYPLEFALPAPYWDYRDQEDLHKELAGHGGCAGPGQRVPENLLFVFGHKDAPLYGRLELGPRSFLVRKKDELEAYIDARVAVIEGQAGGTAEDVQTGWSEKDGMIVHRLEFSAPLQTRGGGCAAPAPQPGGEKMHYLILHYFVHPRGANAMCFFMFLYGPETVFKELQPEVDEVLDSVRYHGDLAADFYDPQAPADKLLSPEEAQTGTKKSPLSNLLMPVLLIFAIWFMLRRRKAKPAE